MEATNCETLDWIVTLQRSGKEGQLEPTAEELRNGSTMELKWREGEMTVTEMPTVNAWGWIEIDWLVMITSAALCEPVSMYNALLFASVSNDHWISLTWWNIHIKSMENIHIGCGWIQSSREEPGMALVHRRFSLALTVWIGLIIDQSFTMNKP